MISLWTDYQFFIQFKAAKAPPATKTPRAKLFCIDLVSPQPIPPTTANEKLEIISLLVSERP